MLDSTAVPARYCSPSLVSTPTQRPPSITSRRTVLLHTTVPPYDSRQSTSASVRLPDPPTGMVQLRRCRDPTTEYASTPEPAESGRTRVW
jgi:hypothetical protein